MSQTLNDTLLEDLQDDAIARLQSDPFFADVWTNAERKGVTVDDIEMALGVLNSQGGKIGLAVVASMPELIVGSPDSPGPEADIRHEFQIFEDPLLNLGEGGTGKSAQRAAINVLNLLHNYTADGLAVRGAMYAEEQPVRPMGALGGVGWLVSLRQPVTVGRTRQVKTPTISEDVGLVTLASATPGALIYYTTDGSYPGPANEEATLYDEPFATPEGPVLIRAGAALADYIPSNTRALEIEA